MSQIQSTSFQEVQNQIQTADDAKNAIKNQALDTVKDLISFINNSSVINLHDDLNLLDSFRTLDTTPVSEQDDVTEGFFEVIDSVTDEMEELEQEYQDNGWEYDEEYFQAMNRFADTLKILYDLQKSWTKVTSDSTRGMINSM